MPNATVLPMPATERLTVTPAQLTLVKTTIAPGATDAELQLFLYDCRRRGVHPLDRQLHFLKRRGRYVPIVSIDFLRSRAAQTGEFGGVDDAVFAGTPKAEDFAATVTVYRFVHDQRCAFVATARWAEYKPDEDFMWQRMPHLMLSKVAESLALRRGFPQELAGLHAAEEFARETPDGDAADPPDAGDDAAGPRMITAAQRKRLFAIAHAHGWPEPVMRAALRDAFRVRSTKAIRVADYERICALLEQPAPVTIASVTRNATTGAWEIALSTGELVVTTDATIGQRARALQKAARGVAVDVEDGTVRQLTASATLRTAAEGPK
jgi:phage recombination protein Bet